MSLHCVAARSWRATGSMSGGSVTGVAGAFVEHRRNVKVISIFRMPGKTEYALPVGLYRAVRHAARILRHVRSGNAAAGFAILRYCRSERISNLRLPNSLRLIYEHFLQIPQSSSTE